MNQDSAEPQKKQRECLNDVIEECVDNMHSIIQSQHDAVKNRQEFIKEITEEIAVFKKGE